MKSFLLPTILLLSTLSFSQSPTYILQKAYDKCQSIQNGYLEMTDYSKSMDNNDTTTHSIRGYFKKLEDDSLSSGLFRFTTTWKDNIENSMLYTGEELVYFSPRDSTAIIYSNNLWSDIIADDLEQAPAYSPFTDKKCSPLPNEETLKGNAQLFKLIGEELINGTPTYHIQAIDNPDSMDTSQPFRILRSEYHFWISKTDFLPLKYSYAIDLFMNNDTMYQYDSFVLGKYDFNNLKDESIFTMSSLPSYYKLMDYTPHQRDELLAVSSTAPAWKLAKLGGDSLSLADTKGKLVLIDFFYKACYGCMLALPGLAGMNEKYKDKGLQIVGIDPYDTKQDDLSKFLSKRNVSYPILLGGTEVAKQYHVSAYPTIYLLDHSGKVIYSAIGYSETSEKKLEEMVKANL